jgi:annexin A7/11
MKGFGTDEKTLIRVLSTKDAYQVDMLRKRLCALVRGPLHQDVHLLENAMRGLGTKEKVLNDVLLGRSNADMRAIKDTYKSTFRRSLEADVKGDLSMKTERHFMMVLAANRNENAPINPQQIDQDVMELYKATEGKTGTDELLVCNILTQRSDDQIREIARTYEAKFRKNLESVIKSVRLHLLIPLFPLTSSLGVLRPYGNGIDSSITFWHR